MRSSKKKTTRFIAMWDMTGLECLINVTAIQKEHEKWEKENIFRILKDQIREVKPPSVPLDKMILRARVNSQRHYEIYTFESELSEKYIKETFSSDPQVIVDAIRNVGHELYSDRVLQKTQVIV
jgi:hypothetical protein